MDARRLLDKPSKARAAPLPSKGADDEILAHPDDARRIHLAGRERRDFAELDALGRELYGHRRLRLRRVGDRLVAQHAELVRHLVAERLDEAEAERDRRVTDVRRREAVAVAEDERVLRLRAG